MTVALVKKQVIVVRKNGTSFIRHFIIISLVIILSITMAVCFVIVLRHVGKEKLKASDAIQKAQVKTAETELVRQKEPQNWEDDWIIYQGDIYEYNDDITTILIMGIDKTDNKSSEEDEILDEGQADALFLLVINNRDESLKIIGINRNTMTDVDIYDSYGNYLTTQIAQIAVQHGFGDTPEKACELEKIAVSKLFYSLPIHAYAAINMSAIPLINDSVGGIDIIYEESDKSKDSNIEIGKPIHLNGSMAYEYLCERDRNEAGSADFRLQRHKKYLLSLMQKCKKLVVERPTLFKDIYNSLADQITTDMTSDEVYYLLSNAGEYSFDSNNLYLLDGVTNVGEVFEEFYPDNDALLKLMIDVFYVKVERNL